MIYKLTIEQTIEERILAVSYSNCSHFIRYLVHPAFQLQDKKRQLANAALSGDKFKNNKLGLDDIMALFRTGGKDESDGE